MMVELAEAAVLAVVVVVVVLALQGLELLVKVITAEETLAAAHRVAAVVVAAQLEVMLRSLAVHRSLETVVMESQTR
jgi:hypothetical protein